MQIDKLTAERKYIPITKGCFVAPSGVEVASTAIFLIWCPSKRKPEKWIPDEASIISTTDLELMGEDLQTLKNLHFTTQALNKDS